MTTVSEQRAVVVAAEADGDFVAVWESLSQDFLGTWGIYARLFNATGTPKGPEILVNAGSITNDQRRPAVAMDASGNFAVAWDGAGIAGVFPSIYVQRYDAAGIPQGSSFTVATGTVLQGKSNAAIAMDGAGNFIVAWESANQDAILTSGVYARLYAAAGTPLTSEFAVNQTTSGYQGGPAAAASGGSYIVAWSGEGSGDAEGVFARRFSAAGAALGNEQRLNATVAGAQGEPALAVSPSGAVLAVWSGAGSGDTNGVFARRYDSSLTPLSGELAINDVTAGVQAGPAAAYDSDENYLIAWSGAGSGDADGVYAREYASDGTARGSAVLVNGTMSGAQAGVSLAPRGENDYVAAWAGEGTGDTEGVFARLLANDQPSVTVSIGAAAYTENAAPIVVDPGLTVADTDHATLSGAVVAISVNYVPGEDVLAFSPQAGISGLWDSSAGVLTLTGAASIADYQAALRTVTYVNTSDNPSTLARTASFAVDDGHGPGVATTRGLSVTAVNDPPVLTTSVGTASYIEDDTGVAVDLGLTASDVDSATLAAATVVISAGYLLGEDALTFTSQSGITGSWSSATGTLILTGVASLTDYQAALRTVAYVNSSQNPSPAPRTLTFTIDDGSDPSASATRGVSVVSINDAPTVGISGGTAAFTEDGPAATIDAGLTVGDVDSSTLTSATVQITSGYVTGQDGLSFTSQAGITGSWDAATGTLSLSGIAALADYQTALRTVVYANGSQNPSAAPRMLTVAIHDGSDPSIAATRALSVTAVNDAPIASTSGGSASFTEDGPAVSIDAAISLSDVDSGTLASATVQITVGFMPSEDELVFTSQSGIAGLWVAASGTLTLSGTASLASYQAALRSIGYGNASQNPTAAARTISITVGDGSDFSAAATRLLAVTGVNDSPVAAPSAGSALFTEDGPAAFVDAGLAATDVDSPTLNGATVWISSGYTSGSDVLTFASQFGISGSWDAATGTLALSGSASVADYQAALRTVTFHNASQNPVTAPRTISFALTDGLDTSPFAARALSVIAVNDAPSTLTSSGTAVFLEGSGQLVIDSALMLSDADSSSLAWATVRIAGGYEIAEDELLYAAQFGIAAAWDPVQGMLTLSGAASVAQYMQALRDVRYGNPSSRPSLALRTFEFVVSDGVDTSIPVVSSAIIIAIDNPAFIDLSGGAATFLEDGPAVSVDPSLLLNDLDSPLLFGVNVAISAGYAAGEDSLQFAHQRGIAGAWDASVGMLSLSGIASVADYEAALRTVLYANTSQDPDISSRTISFSAADATGFGTTVFRQVSVIAANDAPTIAGIGTATPFIEGEAPIVIAPAASVWDVDSARLTGAIVRIAVGYAPGEDRLEWTDVAGITGVWDGATGTLTFSGSADLVAYESALRSVVYVNQSDNPSLASRFLSLTVNDGLSEGVGIVSLVVDGINDAPTLSMTTDVLGYTGDEAITVDAGLIVSDTDSPTLSGATIAVTGGFVSGEDELRVTTQGGLTAVWDPTTGVLTITGDASPEAYQTILRSVTFLSTREEVAVTTRAVIFTVSDGNATGFGFRLVAVAGSTIDPDDPEDNPPIPPVLDPPLPPVTPSPGTPPVTPPAIPPIDPPAGSTDLPPEAPSPANPPETVPPLPPPSVPAAPVITVPPSDPPDSPASPVFTPPVVPTASPPTTPPESPVIAESGDILAVSPLTIVQPLGEQASASGTIQLIEVPSPGIDRLAGGRIGSGARVRLTTALVEVGSTLGAGYVVWLLVNYSVVRHALFALPKFDPMDVHCLLSLAPSRRTALR